MNRLEAELQRLSFLPSGPGPARAMTLSLSGAGAWDSLASLWQGVQVDLGLPPPAIAVAGYEGYQLWFAFSPPVDAAQARGVLDALVARYLAEVPQDRIRIAPAGAPPPRELEPGRWSAFVTPDLAGLFSDETWLDLQPGEEAQAELLARVQPMPAGELQRVLEQFSGSQPGPVQRTGPRDFLLGVMNDASVPLPLRIEAARALLPYTKE